ncbi:replicative DNA helicase [Paenibacillus gansuensis]|uniref:Replicative DNA helicase n=1 Tax=Paenibacillus gansuensis TaxID=306542 RepID=A0ABW5PFR1_9BACL
MQQDRGPKINMQELPRNLEAERSVLGAIILEPKCYDIVADMLSGEEFTDPANQEIYQAMKSISAGGEPVDIVLLATKLSKSYAFSEIGGIGYLTGLASSVPSAANVEYYVAKLKENSVHRNAIIEIQKQAHLARNTDDPAQLVASMQAAAQVLADQTVKKSSFRLMSEVAQECFQNIENAHYSGNKGGLTGISAGFADLDKMTSGFQKSDLIIVGARPSVGKTAFALNIAQNVGIRQKETVAIFSLEMSATQLVTRMMCAEGNIDAHRLRTGMMEADDWEKATMALGSLTDAEIYIDDSPGITVSEIRSKCRQLKKDKGLGLILIDYLQLIQGRGKGDRQQDVSEISRTLKQIARELEVPVIALSQLSRGVEQRQDKRPMMSDLRESGSIEQDADIVAFLYRDDYYNAESEKKNIIEIILAKQRNGPVGTVELIFLKNYNKFVSLDRAHYDQPHPGTNSNSKDKRNWA